MKKRQGETSYKETALGIIPRSKIIPLEIEGVRRAWKFILEKRENRNIPITPQFIKKLHWVAFGWIFPKTAGNFRTMEVTVSDHLPPAYFQIPQYIDNFCQDLGERLKHLQTLKKPNSLDKLIKLLSWLHHQFLWIHPFKDYNGRIGRLLINVVLLNLDLPPIELRVETKSGRHKYIEALKLADKGNYSQLEFLIRSAIEETSKELITSV